MEFECYFCHKILTTKKKYKNHINKNKKCIDNYRENIRPINQNFIEEICGQYKPVVKDVERTASNIVNLISKGIKDTDPLAIVCLDYNKKLFAYVSDDMCYEEDPNGTNIIPMFFSYLIEKFDEAHPNIFEYYQRIQEFYQVKEDYKKVIMCIAEMRMCADGKKDCRLYKIFSKWLAEKLYTVKKQRDFIHKHIGVKLK
jgi:hypothetical protein